jgi:O-antigen ligase
VQWLLGAMLIFAPLFRSGQLPLALLALQLLAVAVLALVLWRPRPAPITRAEGLALIMLLVLPLLYLIPVPGALAALLPGRGVYVEAQALLMAAPPDRWAPSSLVPVETEQALLFLLIPVGVFLGVRVLRPDRAMPLVLLLLGVAALQALIGLLQYGAGKGSPELLGISLADARVALGTYTNQNHLAGLLNMVLPIALGLMVFSVGRGRDDERAGWRGRVAFFASLRGHKALMYGAIALLLLVGVIFTRSRAGIALAMLGVLVATVAFARRIGGSNVYGPTGTVVAFALGIGIAIGLVPVLDRFSAEGAIADARWGIFSATLSGIGTFLPFGSGPGNYPDVFPAFQPAELGRWFINHAHNDYLEWLFEGGLLAGALVVFVLALYLRQWARVWPGETWSRLRFVQVGAGIGMLLLALHGLVDYNLHIAANVVYFAFLAGIFFSDPATEAWSRRRRRRTPDLAGVDAEAPAAAAGRPASDQIPNPFLD